MSTQLHDAADALRSMLATYRAALGGFAFAQAWHESRALHSALAVQARNYWGIKWSKSTGQQSISFNTWEIEAGKRVEVAARFVLYPSVEASVAAYYSLLKRRYRLAYDATTIEQFARGLVVGPRKWATDPTYQTRILTTYAALVKRGILAVT